MIRHTQSTVLVFLLVTTFAVTGARTGTPVRPHVEEAAASGIKHFSRLNDSVGYAGPVVGFGGATNASVMTGLKGEGFVAVINLRLADEEGATVAANRLAAEAAGLKYIHLPFDPQDPTPDLVDDFLRAVGEASNQPVFIHCNSATRVAALWMIGRVVKDGWELDDAATEAGSIAMKPDEAIAFASAYLKRLR